MEVGDDPIADLTKLMRAGGVGKQGGEMPFAPARVQDREPSLGLGVES
jgi:hypothetical protein